MTDQVPAYDDAEAPAPPAHWEADVVVADGGTVHLRPVRPSDAPKLVALHAGLSPHTRYLRYFSAYPRIPERDLYRFSHVDHHDRVALLVELGGEAIAVGRYEREDDSDTDDGPSAEVAFVVADAQQGRGIGSVLLEHLAAAGRESGIRRFTAVVLAENLSMIRVFRDAGYEIARRLDYGEVSLRFSITETATTEAVMREREQRAEARSIERLLFPGSVAVIGASNDQAKIGHAVFANLLRMGFQGPIYAINPDARHVGGVPAYPSVLDVPGAVDIAVIAVPAASVAQVVDQCARRGVRGLVVISGGFGESGTDEQRAEGLAAQRALVLEARSHGMRVVGPNCLGVINTADDVRLNASLTPLPPLTGRVGFFCQSGALGVAVLGEAARRGLGISTFVSAGNRADVSGNDLLQFWETDPATDVVLMYLESFGNPRKFARLTRRLGRRKPIVAVNSAAGATVDVLAHTGVRLPEHSARALFERSGVIRVETLSDMFDVSLLLASQPLPAGPRVAVVGNSTALGVLVTNACAAEGLSLARLDDVGVDAAAEAFETALRAAVDDEGVDAVVVVFVPPLQRTAGRDVAVVVRTVAEASGKPVLSTFLGFEGVPEALAARGPSAPARGSVPSYPSPERAVRALARAVRYARWRARPPGELPDPDGLPGFDLPAARSVVTAALAAAPVAVPSSSDAAASGAAASGVAASGAVVSDAAASGAVAPGPATRDLDADEAARLLAAAGLQVSPGPPGDGLAVALAVTGDRSFGALVSFGLGGVVSELLDDRAYAAVPLTTADAEELIVAPKAAPLLTGTFPGSTARDLAALREVALRLSVLADELPELAELHLDALALPLTPPPAADGSSGADGASGVVVRAVRARVAPASARADTGPRRMRGL